MAVELKVKPWCQFVYTHECRDPVLVTKDIFTFGRSPECDGSFIGCKFMSAKHCYIMKDKEGKAWLYDTSTNGTLVNGKRIKAQSVHLCNNDEIKLVHRKDVSSIGFVYIEIKEDAAETVLENTQEYEQDDEEDTPRQQDSQEDLITTIKENISTIQGKRTHCQISSISDSPEAKQQKLEPKPDLTRQNSLAENLMCTICQDIFHDCVSLQPCMHSYCAACYSQWMDKSNECPTCRLKVSRINRNHLINNLVEAFLKDNPDRKRSKQEIEEMDIKNKITHDMLKPPSRRNAFGEPYFGDSESDSMENLSGQSGSDDSFSDDYDDDDDDDQLNPFHDGASPMSVAGLFGFLRRNLSRTPGQVCRQCPSSTIASCTSSSTGGDTSANSGPSFVCSPSGSHILCLCCMQHMPDRRTDCNTDSNVPRQTCCICNRAFCHLYWGCRGTCNGCIKQFKDFTFQDSIDRLINDNNYESTIFKDYLTTKSITMDDVLKKCIEKLESKEYKPKDNQLINSTIVLCKKCALKNFQELAYQYRKDVPCDDLPGHVTTREDCYWGRNCRTQRKPHHALRFNHICEQKRFT